MTFRLRSAALAATVVISTFAQQSVNAATPDVVELTAGQIESDFAAGKYTATELVQAYLDRIAKYNPTYNAFTYLNPADALAQAASRDAQLAANGGVVPANKPLFGVPVVIKDSMNVAGVRTTGGYSGFTAENGGADMIPLADAPIVARLRDAGAIILGKTNLPQFARSGASANTSYLGPTYNTFNITRVPGGSSSGTATAVSGSFATIGTAEETGGSIQNPAGAQALVGVKTTFGLVPTSGGIPLNGSTRDVFGTNAKSVKDAARMLGVIAGADASDANTAGSTVASGHLPAAGYLAGLSTTSLQGKRFGLFSTAFKNVTLSSDVNTLYTATVNKLTSLGATVVTDPFSDPALSTPFNQLAATFSQYSGSNEPYDLQQWMKTMDPSKSPTSVQAFKTRTGIDLMAQSGPLLGSFAATSPNTDAGPGLANAAANPDVNQTAFVDKFMAGRANMLAAFRKVMADNNLDGFFFPEQSAEPGLLPAGTATGSYSNTTVSEINLMGTPQVNLPGGYYADGTPFSVAFLGDTYSEADLLDYAYAFEQATLFRTAPTLVPEPGTLAFVALAGLPLLAGRRPRAA
jgi:Asp-tRNA(Asn)/Glu-tRNA(Gln) amidotransferase A subunit family amidase